MYIFTYSCIYLGIYVLFIHVIPLADDELIPGHFLPEASYFPIRLHRISCEVDEHVYARIRGVSDPLRGVRSIWGRQGGHPYVAKCPEIPYAVVGISQTGRATAAAWTRRSFFSERQHDFTRCPRRDRCRPLKAQMALSENRGTLLGGVPLRGFYSIWGFKGVPLFWENPKSTRILSLLRDLV